MKRFYTLYRLPSRLGVLVVLLLATVHPALARETGMSFSNAPAGNSAPPADPVKLVFIHHSTGGNWLGDPNNDQPYGGLGIALRDNNYFVSATNYGWGPESIGDRTDIPNWPEWFTGPNSSAYLNALYNESGQNIGDFGHWSRLATDPGGENEIVMFKSCFPNSDLYGNPGDPPASAPNDQYTVSNAKGVYNNLLTYFETRQDKLFIVIAAPPMAEGEYGSDAQSPAERAANARAFNNWLVNDWLAGYSYSNVAVFDYYNVLTSNGSSDRLDAPGTNEEPNDAGQEDGNHHRWWNGAIQHVQTIDNNYSAYPTDSSWDSHPTTAGHQKATAEFVPLLNVTYNRWQAGAAAPQPTPTATPEPVDQPTATPTQEVQPTPTATQEARPTPGQPPAGAGVIDDMEGEDYWESYGDDAGSTVASGLDVETAHGGSASLRIEYNIVADGWGDCGRSFESPKDWSSGNGVSLWIHSDGTGQPLALMLLTGDPEAPTPFITHFETTAESAAGWAQFAFSWTDFALAQWADEGGLAEVDPTQVVALGFNFSPSKGVVWVDDVGLATGEVQPPPKEASPTATTAPQEETPPTATSVPEEAPPTATAVPEKETPPTATAVPEEAPPTATPEPAEPDEPAESKGGLCSSAVALPLAAVGVAWTYRRRRAIL